MVCPEDCQIERLHNAPEEGAIGERFSRNDALHCLAGHVPIPDK